MPAASPVHKAMNAVAPTTTLCDKIPRSVVTNAESGLRAKSTTSPTAKMYAAKLIKIDSATKARRIFPTELPSTFCVLMLRMRMGVSAMLKLVKFIPAIRSTTNAMAVNTCRAWALAFGMLSNCTLETKCTSGRGVKRRSAPTASHSATPSAPNCSFKTFVKCFLKFSSIVGRLAASSTRIKAV